LNFEELQEAWGVATLLIVAKVGPFLATERDEFRFDETREAFTLTFILQGLDGL